ncbi:MAG: glycosyltransferase family 39 protein [Candidatus Omnitrophica bacterium]|nr:glycosyltransferase family 39 protein [Candidatus Omnitrophota bacterium]
MRMRGALAAMLLAALALRAWGITTGLPGLYWHDETGTLMGSLRIGVTGLRGAGYSYFHGSLLSLLLFAAEGAYYLVGRLTGAFASLNDFLLHVASDPSGCVILVRAVLVAVSVGVVALTYALGERLVDQTTGLIAALGAAVSFGFVQLAFGKEDQLYTLLLLTSVWALLRSLEAGAKPSGLFASGALLGLAMGVKYLALLGGVFILVAWWWHREQLSISRLLVWGAGFLGGLLAGIPALLVDLAAVWRDASQIYGANTSHGFLVIEGPNTSWLSYAGPTVSDNVGIVLAVACGAGVLRCLQRRDGRLLSWLLAYPIVLTIVLARVVWIGQGNAVPYFQLPAMPFLLILAALGIREALASSHRAARAAGLAVLCAGVLVNGPPIIRYKRWLASDDTRTLAKAWLEARVPAGSRIAVEGGLKGYVWAGPQLAEDEATLQREIERSRQEGGTGRFWEERARALHRGAAPRYTLTKVVRVSELTEEQLRAHDYVVLSRRHDEPWAGLPSFEPVERFEPAPPISYDFAPMLSRTDLLRLRVVPLWGPARLAKGPRIVILRRAAPGAG